MAYEVFKNLPKRVAFDKLLCHKAFNFVKNLKHNGYQRGLDSMVCKCFDKKPATHTGRGININSDSESQ